MAIEYLAPHALAIAIREIAKWSSEQVAVGGLQAIGAKITSAIDNKAGGWKLIPRIKNSDPRKLQADLCDLIEDDPQLSKTLQSLVAQFNEAKTKTENTQQNNTSGQNININKIEDIKADSGIGVNVGGSPTINNQHLRR